MREGMRKPKAIIVVGSIAGISCTKALILAGWDVVVIEKIRGPPTGNPTGAGIALHPLSQKIVKSWLHQPDLLHNITLPLTIDQVSELKTSNATESLRNLAADESLISKAIKSKECAWRGVFDFSENENSETIQGVRKAYPTLGNGVHMDLASGTYTVLDELMYKRLNSES
ncbi:hypothetical protein CICLE_v10010790mg [Citrus x clementina]|uniref:FAD-binding domain-containing protein n=1 Tax=Citrus clementina TaxID=85681 RepID=V4UN06_CITCL|nr:hypothetical protein CICLE_v10010790mg [Citrus x clementina]